MGWPRSLRRTMAREVSVIGTANATIDAVTSLSE